MLVDDITRIDSTFVPEHVYPQVPAFSGPASLSPRAASSTFWALRVTLKGASVALPWWN